MKMRTSMKFWMIICFVLAGCYACSSFSTTVNKTIVGAALIAIVFSFMFLILGFTPKDSKYIYFHGKRSSIDKYLFVVLCFVVAALLFVMTEATITSISDRDARAAERLLP